MDCQDIERIVRRAGLLMAENLWDYWPSEGNNDISERNISLYFSIAFHDKGVKSFAECHWKGETDKRLDFFAINPETGVAICAECKRLFNAEKCQEIVDDFKRIKSFVALEYCGKYKPRFGVLAATTFKSRIVEWWSTSDADWPSSHESWKTLYSKLKDAYWGSIPLNSYDEETKLAYSPKSGARWGQAELTS